MKRPLIPNAERLEMLVNDLLNGQLDSPKTLELRALLLTSKRARSYYQEQVALHSHMSWLMRDGKLEESDPKEAEALIHSPPRKKRLLAVACVPVVLALLVVIWMTRESPRPETIATAPNPVVKTSTVLGQSSNLKWHQDSPTAVKGAALEAQTYHLLEGFLRLDIGDGSKVFVEAPCKFEPVHEMLLKVHEGRVNAEVNEQGHGFTIWTPAGKFVDLGTRFGIGVGTDEFGNDVILSEVFTGEVKVAPRDRKPDAEATIAEGDTLSLLGRLSYVEVSKTVDARPIKLDFNRYEKTSIIKRYRAQDDYNLALGKPVVSTSTYVGSNGEVFPAKNLTDGRINDTGFPGNWSFWLASNENPIADLVIDLGRTESFDCLQLLNTHNRHHRDRGTKDFTCLVSENGRDFTEVISGTLEKVERKLTADGKPAIHTFLFPEQSARYLKIKIHTFYRAPVPSTSAGLNEIRLFGSSLPAEMKREMFATTQTTIAEEG
jgi:hypothetical protein